MTELSSLTASVTLAKLSQFPFPPLDSHQRVVSLHQRVGLLLLLEDGCRGIELLRFKESALMLTACRRH